jgi:uncharacterized membrane protein YkvA (DUF1232 family)
MSESAAFTVEEGVPPVRRSRKDIIRETAVAAPNLVKLLYRLLRDPRVPAKRKALVGAAVVYMASPVDLIPEMLFPVVGQLDDLVLVVLAVHSLIGSVDDDVVTEYWDGSEDALDLVAALVEWGSEMVPRPIRRFLST